MLDLGKGSDDRFMDLVRIHHKSVKSTILFQSFRLVILSLI
jgi:hypothetical protein